MWKLKAGRRQVAFVAVMLLALLPLLLLLAGSQTYNRMRGFPKVRAGALDLGRLDLSRGQMIPLDGEWEFFPGRWIVSDLVPEEGAGYMVQVPMPWHLYPGQGLEAKGIGSFRITVRNGLPGQALMAFVPNLDARYRAYLDGELVAARGNMDLSGDFADMDDPARRGELPHGVAVPTGGAVTLVVEVASPHVGGLYQTPQLMEVGAFHLRYDARNMIATGILSVTFLTFVCFAYPMLRKDRLFVSYGLLALDLIAFLRILFQTSYLQPINRLLGGMDYLVNTALQVATLFLPVVFLLCMRQILGFEVENRRLKSLVAYDLGVAPLILWAALSGRPHLTFLLYLGGCLPFLLVIVGLYQRVRDGTPYALGASAALMTVLASVIGTSMVGTGVLVVDVSLFPPAYFMLAMLFQLLTLLQRSIEMQRQAVEAENLRLRLKQVESDLMLSQIKPHFLYNALIAIHMLCTQAPETAAEATLKFATYLRTNMTLIDQRGAVPFEQELAHIRNYADIEQLRHQRRLTLRYEVGTTQFCVPALSIQPIVENAIRHGACRNISGGTVVLRTYETQEQLVVEVEDDGPGFDLASVLGAAEGTHGLQNIRYRLERAGAKLQIDTAPGQGTRVRVLVPKEGTG